MKTIGNRLRASISAGMVLLMLTLSLAAVSSPSSAALTPVWTSATPMGGPRTFPVIVQNEDGLVYVMGGVVNGSSWTSVPLANSYDPMTGDWTTLAPMTKGLRWATGALGLDGKVYVCAGFNDTDGALYAPVQIYDPVDDSWSTGASIPTPVSFACAVTLDDGLIYVVGGRDVGYNAVTLVQVYDPVMDSWSTSSALPAGRYGGTAVEWDGYIIYAGGYLSGSIPTADVLYLYPGWGWDYLASMPSARYFPAGVVGGDGLIYVMGGDSEGTPSSAAYVFNPYDDEWIVLPNLNTGMTYASSAAYAPDGRILVLGGTNWTAGSRALDRVESLQILTKSITLSSNSVNQGGSVLVTVTCDFAYLTPESYSVDAYLWADSVAYNYAHVSSPLPGAFGFEVSIPQNLAAGTHQIVLADLRVSYGYAGWNLGTTELTITVGSSFSIDEQLAMMEANVSALQMAMIAAMAEANASTMAYLQAQLTALQGVLAQIGTGLTTMGAAQTVAMASLNATLADLQVQLDAFQEQIDRVEDKADTAGTYGMVTLVLVIIVIVLLGLMLVMTRRKP